MGMKSAPAGVSSICLKPLLRRIREQFSSFSNSFSRWLTVGWDRNSASAVLEMLFVLTMERNISISVKSIQSPPEAANLLAPKVTDSLPHISHIFQSL